MSVGPLEFTRILLRNHVPKCYVISWQGRGCVRTLRHSYGQGRIIHCAGCTMGGGPRHQGAPIGCQIFNTLFRRLIVQCRLKRDDDWKKVVNFLGEKVHRQRKSWLRVREKCPPYVGMGPPEWLIRRVRLRHWWSHITPSGKWCAGKSRPFPAWLRDSAVRTNSDSRVGL